MWDNGNPGWRPSVLPWAVMCRPYRPNKQHWCPFRPQKPAVVIFCEKALPKKSMRTTPTAAATAAAGTMATCGRVDAARIGGRTTPAARMARRGAHLTCEFFRTATRAYRLFATANQQLAVILAFLTIIFVNRHNNFCVTISILKQTACDPVTSLHFVPGCH